MISNPVEMGWERATDGTLKINWISFMLGPEQIQQLPSCDCHEECKIYTCVCITNNLNCTGECHLFTGDNDCSVEAEHYFNGEDEVEETNIIAIIKNKWDNYTVIRNIHC